MQKQVLNNTLESLMKDLFLMKTEFLKQLSAAEDKIKRVLGQVDAAHLFSPTPPPQVIIHCDETKKSFDVMSLFKTQRESNVIYNSDISGFSHEEFNSVVLNRPDITLLVTTDDGVLGVVLRSPVTKIGQFGIDEDMEVFVCKEGEVRKMKKNRSVDGWRNSIELFLEGSNLFCVSWMMGVADSDLKTSWFHEHFNEHYTKNLNFPQTFTVKSVLVIKN
ncbi:hypothetical protein EIN_181990 [Entamoeba invadens IP1]|uniref:hypothetical protein n=1 Tax=Entamoeba invadens IP1 TaxID=370355 RepID=UPI0002C3D056|nr:hypothetical protein EIN_181990 [Entamoeba invadens IP1]ELP94002.1 hypothetical protein EIN_181990 [Entamoeba invadens IP1]|eukprot:XP_004260773.1 hypothetical protein EIN_181990 [Entamoeba invadens IP1]